MFFIKNTIITEDTFNHMYFFSGGGGGGLPRPLPTLDTREWCSYYGFTYATLLLMVVMLHFLVMCVCPHGSSTSIPRGGGGAGGGTLIFSAYVGSDPASTVHPKKVSEISSTPQKYLKF